MKNPAIQFESVTYTYPETETPVFSDLDLTLPDGVVSFVGQNGTGKSTALLLASGRVLPDSGSVTLIDRKTDTITDESERNRYASFIYQNMEFDTEEPVSELFEFVYENGFHDSKDSVFLFDLIKAFELEKSIERRLQDLSKGEIQRAILVFSMLYGSKAIVMDEPIFALEDRQKQRALEFVHDYARKFNTPVFYSLHELDLSKLYADYGLVFFNDGRPPYLGPAEEAFSRELIESAFQYPAAMLHQREHLFREQLIKIAEMRLDTDDAASTDEAENDDESNLEVGSDSDE